jgi:hypothetical protein
MLAVPIVLDLALFIGSGESLGHARASGVAVFSYQEPMNVPRLVSGA